MSFNTTGSTQMTKSDRIISDLMTALDAIQRESHDSDGSLDWIFGCAGQAMKNCDARRRQNTDGYLVATHDGAIDAGVSNGIEEAWRVLSCNIDLSDGVVRERIQAIIVQAVKDAI